MKNIPWVKQAKKHTFTDGGEHHAYFLGYLSYTMGIISTAFYNVLLLFLFTLTGTCVMGFALPWTLTDDVRKDHNGVCNNLPTVALNRILLNVYQIQDKLNAPLVHTNSIYNLVSNLNRLNTGMGSHSI